MPGTTYRMKHPTFCLFLEDGRYVARMMHQGAVISVPSLGSSKNSVVRDKLVEVTWQGTKLLMFGRDVRARARKVSGDFKVRTRLNRALKSCALSNLSQALRTGAVFVVCSLGF